MVFCKWCRTHRIFIRNDFQVDNNIHIINSVTKILFHPSIYETVSFYQLAAHLLDLPLHLSEILIISEYVTGASLAENYKCKQKLSDHQCSYNHPLNDTFHLFFLILHLFQRIFYQKA